MTVCRRIGGKAANSSCTSILLDSDCEEEPTRKVHASRKRRLSSCLQDDDDRPEEVSVDRQTIMSQSLFLCVCCCIDVVFCVFRGEQQ